MCLFSSWALLLQDRDAFLTEIKASTHIHTKTQHICPSLQQGHFYYSIDSLNCAMDSVSRRALVDKEGKALKVLNSNTLSKASSTTTLTDTKKMPATQPASAMLGNSNSIYLSNLKVYQQQALKTKRTPQLQHQQPPPQSSSLHLSSSSSVAAAATCLTDHPTTTAQSLYQQQQAKRLQYYHTRPPVYVVNPSFTLDDFQLLDTLGKRKRYLDNALAASCNAQFANSQRHWNFWACLSYKVQINKQILCHESAKEIRSCSVETG